METSAGGLIILGLLLIAGLGIDELGRRTRLPRVSLLVAVGALAGPIGFDVLAQDVRDWFPTIAAVALVMVGFLLGSEFSLSGLREHGRPVVTIAVAQAFITAAVVVIGLLLIGTEPEIALALGGIAVATDPAAVVDVIDQSGVRGRFTRHLRGVVAVDDAIGMGIFSLLLVTAAAMTGSGDAAAEVLFAVREIFGGVLLGAGIGIPVALLSGRVRPGTPTLEEALGAVLLCAGLAAWLEVSFLIAAVVMGTIVVNLARHHTRAFREIESIEWPFLVVFFILTGASLDSSFTAVFGVVGAAYLVLRTAGKLLGGSVGARAAHEDPADSRWFGVSLLPQAGVALGMALLAAEQFPSHRETLLSIAVAGTIIFEILGPILARIALGRVHEVP